MTINKAIERVSELKPNPYTEERLAEVIVNMELQLHTVTIKDEYTELAYPADGNATLTVDSGFGDAYIYRLAAEIDMWNRDISEYNNDKIIFNDIMEQWTALYRRNNNPNKETRITNMFPWKLPTVESEVF